jgi:hypothetical protein
LEQCERRRDKGGLSLRKRPDLDYAVQRNDHVPIVMPTKATRSLGVKLSTEM